MEKNPKIFIGPMSKNIITKLESATLKRI